MKIRIGVADDHLLVINGLKAMIASQPNLEIVFGAMCGTELLACLTEVQPDVLLLDIRMPGESGIDLCKTIKTRYPSVKVIALTNFDELNYVKQMIRNGSGKCSLLHHQYWRFKQRKIYINRQV